MFDLDRVISWILSKQASKVALQFPEGLKIYAQRISAQIESATGASCIICADPCFGACDYDTKFESYADVLVQFGHASIPSMNSSDKILFVEVLFDVNIDALAAEALPLLKPKICMISAVQYLPTMLKLKEFLESHGVDVIVNHGDSRIMFDGQILGCNISPALAADVEQYLYVGSGNFHPLSIAIEAGKDVLILDPQMNELRDLKELKDKLLRQRYGAIARCADANHFLILASSKPGQLRLEKTYEVKELLESHGKKADIVVMERFDPEYLAAFNGDAFVSTACSRIALDDYLRYPKPIITPIELEIVLGIRTWEDYHLDFY